MTRMNRATFSRNSWSTGSDFSAELLLLYGQSGAFPSLEPRFPRYSSRLLDPGRFLKFHDRIEVIIRRPTVIVKSGFHMYKTRCASSALTFGLFCFFNRQIRFYHFFTKFIFILCISSDFNFRIPGIDVPFFTAVVG